MVWLSRRRLLAASATAGAVATAGCSIGPGSGECHPAGMVLECSVTEPVPVTGPMPLSVRVEFGTLEGDEDGLLDVELVGYGLEREVGDDYEPGGGEDRGAAVERLGSIALGDLLLEEATDGELLLQETLPGDPAPDLIVVELGGLRADDQAIDFGWFGIGTARALTCEILRFIEPVRETVRPTDGVIPPEAFGQYRTARWGAHPENLLANRAVPIALDLADDLAVGEATSVSVTARLPDGTWDDVTEDARLEFVDPAAGSVEGTEVVPTDAARPSTELAVTVEGSRLIEVVSVTAPE